MGGLVALTAEWGFLGGASSPAPTPRERIDLGIRDSDAATITWIGFQEPTEHEAKQSTTEQAAQTAGGGSPGVPTALRETVIKQAEATSRTAAAALDAAVRALREIDFTVEDNEQPEERVEPEAGEAAKGAPQETEPAERPGDSERESDAVSIEEPLKIQWGKPIAAEGLEIITTRKGPDFSAYTSVTARPKPLFVEISFGPEGVQQVKRVEKLGSSGNEDIDRPYINVIYRWRARGERIDALAEGEVVKVRLRIIVNL